MVHIDVSLLEGICPQRKNIIQTGGPLKNDKLIWVLDPSNPRAHPSYLLLLPPPVANLAFHLSKMFSWLSSASTHVVFTWSHVLFTWSHIHSGEGAVNVLLHLLTCSMLRFRRLLHMITHTFGWGGLRFRRLLYMIAHLADIFHATLYMYSLHDCTSAYIFHATLYMYSLHDCTSRLHLSCYAAHVFFTWLHIPLTSFMLRCTCLLYMIVHLRCMLEAWNVAAANEKGKNTEFATGGGALLLVESQFLRTCP